MKFIMRKNAEMPTIIDTFTFISMLNATSESFEEGKGFHFSLFKFYELYVLEKLSQ